MLALCFRISLRTFPVALANLADWPFRPICCFHLAARAHLGFAVLLCFRLALCFCRSLGSGIGLGSLPRRRLRGLPRRRGLRLSSLRRLRSRSTATTSEDIALAQRLGKSQPKVQRANRCRRVLTLERHPAAAATGSLTQKASAGKQVLATLLQIGNGGVLKIQKLIAN